MIVPPSIVWGSRVRRSGPRSQAEPTWARGPSQAIQHTALGFSTLHRNESQDMQLAGAGGHMSGPVGKAAGGRGREAGRQGEAEV